MIQVTKRNGKLEPLDISKISRVVAWACEDLDVCQSTIETESHIQFFDGMTTTQIHETLINTTAELISASEPDYQYASARLLIYHIRKKAFGTFKPTPLYEHITLNTCRQVYDPEIIEKWSPKEILELDSYIDHDRDFMYAYAGARQLEAKYLVQDRTTDAIYESPQQAIMLIAMCLHQDESVYNRIQYAKDFYDAVSLFKLNLPTPIMAGVRTPTRQFSSCVKIESGDSLDSINATTSAIVNYASKRAGIGINAGAIRAVGSPIRRGEAKHTGVLPFYRYMQSALKSCSQGGIRGASATLHFPIWHKEFEQIIQQKNNKNPDNIRHMDYSVQLNKYFYQRILDGKPISFISPDVYEGELYEAFFADQDKFAQLYEQAEADPEIDKVVLDSEEVIYTVIQERAAIGRIYIMNVDNTNNYSPFEDTIKMSNLCVAPETKILTDRGHETIKDLEGQYVKLWNGQEFSESYVTKTGSNQELIKVTFSNGDAVECTPYHKFYPLDSSYNPREVRASELCIGDKVEAYTSEDKMYYTDVISVVNESRYDDTYCALEPKRNKIVVNGILTGNCQEITLPTSPLTTKGEGEIALCTLAAFNVTEVKADEYAHLSRVIVRALDNLLDYQDYPAVQAERTLDRRSLGVGVINFAALLASKGLSYSDKESNNLTHELFETIQYNLLHASCDLAEEKGECLDFHRTTYSNGWLPVDEYKEDTDALHTAELKHDWQHLFNRINDHGLRNSTLTALMPSESSSQVSNATNGIEPPRSLVSVKNSKDGMLKQVVPNVKEWDYELLWDRPALEENKGYLECVGIMQKFVDQAISTNLAYDPTKYDNEQVPMSLMFEDILLAYKYGLKTLYYHNTRDSQSDGSDQAVIANSGCDSGACAI